MSVETYVKSTKCPKTTSVDIRGVNSWGFDFLTSIDNQPGLIDGPCENITKMDNLIFENTSTLVTYNFELFFHT